jgi:cell division protein FtsW
MSSRSLPMRARPLSKRDVPTGAAIEREQPARHAPDYPLLTAVAMLLIIGLVTVYSASFALGFVQFGDANYFVKRQAVWAALGIAGMLVAMQLDYRLLLRLSPLLMLAALIGLAAALVPGLGVEQNGAQRWVQLGPLPAVQPSEFAKLAVVIYKAAWLAAKGDAVRSLSLGVLPFVAMVGLVGALVMLEPDLGTAVIIAIITGTLFFIAGARLWHVLVLGGSGVVTASLLIVTGGYRMDRILSFTSAEADPQGVGFQTLQLLVAFGSGGISGLGLGVSRQKFFFVPGSHTDGVLAILGEELGLIGVTVVIALFAMLLWRGLVIARRAADPFGSLLAMGIVTWIGFQALINAGGVTRLLPLTGIPLPFLSAGGSSLAVTLTAVGVLLSVSRRAALTREAPETTTRERAARAATLRARMETTGRRGGRGAAG